MRALLDAGVLVALLDAQHARHTEVWTWFEAEVERGWASCPLTQNGVLRIMSHPRYPNPVPVGDLLERLGDACASSWHQFWVDDVSLVDPDRIAFSRVLSPRQLTDAHLLSLAVSHGGRLVTLDERVQVTLVPDARPEHLSVLR